MLANMCFHAVQRAQRARATPAWCKICFDAGLRAYTQHVNGTTVKTAIQQDVHSLDGIDTNRSRVLGCSEEESALHNAIVRWKELCR